MPLPSPVVVVPGITATYLTDYYRLPPENLWSPTLTIGAKIGIDNHFSRLSLHPTDPRYETVEPARVAANQIYTLVYDQLIQELRSTLGDGSRPVPVYPFAYDWRRPLPEIEAQLGDFINEVIDRTRLMARAYPEYRACREVNLVGHSLGGLVIAGYLAGRSDGVSRVAKVVTLGTPFRGSYEAIAKVTTGTASEGGLVQCSRERKNARVTPSLYYLLPSFDGALTVETPDAFDRQLGPAWNRCWFNPNLWQASIKESIANYYEEHHVSPTTSNTEKGGKADRDTLFLRLLESGRIHRTRLEELDIGGVGMTQSDWLCIVGVNVKTRVALPVGMAGGRPVFRLRGRDRRDNWNLEPDSSIRRETGDKTVPFLGAVPQFLDYQSLVCVTPRDFGYWEVGDRGSAWLLGFHGLMPNMNMLHRMITRHFTERRDAYGNTWGRPPPGVSERDWEPPLPLRCK